LAAKSTITTINHAIDDDIELIEICLVTGKRYLLAFNRNKESNSSNAFTYQNNDFSFNGRFKLFELSNK
jgi:hypothetical protein